MEKKHCKFCGKIVDTDSRFCIYCGGNIENNIQTEQSLLITETYRKIEDSVIPFKNEGNKKNDPFLIIGLVNFLIILCWVSINRFVKNAYDYKNFLNFISLITLPLIPLLCFIYTKKQSYRIILALCTGFILFYYIFVFYIEK